MLRQPSILIVEDNPSEWNFASTTLSQAGYRVDRALNGQHALAKVTTSYPQCLIINVFLSDTSGYALCRQIRQSITERQVPIILTSKKASRLDQNYGLNQGAQRFLPKPFTARQLIQAVEAVLPEEALQASTTPSSQHPRLRLVECIPHHFNDHDEMRNSNPFAYTALKNGRARRLYGAIDGKRTVHELSTALGLNTKEISDTLHVLIDAHYVQLYNSAGDLVDDVLEENESSSSITNAKNKDKE